MTTREDIELYVMGQYDGDAAVLEAALASDPALAVLAADEARFELVLRDAAATATFCPSCDDLVRGERCDSCGAAIRPGGYTVERVLVSNAHGRMYVAHDADGKQVALKELAFVQAPSLDAIAAFEREAKFLRALEHPAIPRFLASFEEGRGVHARYYLAQELVVGDALDRLDDHWYTEAEIVELAKQVLEIIVYLQSLSPMVIHRDIKPANLLRRRDGTIALVDFGAAHVQGTTAGSTTIGTFGYMPIEQLAGIVDATTDVYALGATLLHLLTRQEPWRLAQNHTTPNVSAPLRAFLEKLVASDPRDRFASAKDALAGLERRDQLVSRKRKPMQKPAILGITIAAALAASGAGIYRLRQSPSASPPPPAAAAPRHSVRAHANLPHGKLADLSFKAAPLHDVLRFLANQCELNLVIPDFIDARITVELTKVTCDQEIEVLLESNGLWYDYLPDAKLIRVAPRKELDRDAEASDERARTRGEHWQPDDVLPAGNTVDVDLKDAPLRSTLSTIAAGGGTINVVMPDSIDGRVTMVAKAVPWQAAFQSVLASHGLWYRYRDNGKIIRIAPRKELDREDEAELERSRH